jgi:voltage-gated potassium channel
MRKFSDGKGSKNNIVLRVAWSACLWDMRRIEIAKIIADALNRHIEGEVKHYSLDLKAKKCGY